MDRYTKASAVIAAAGLSSRMKGVNKQFLLLNGVPVLARTLMVFDGVDEIGEIIIVVQKSEILVVNDLVREFGIKKVKAVVPGGDTRQKSVYEGLKNVHCGKVLIHDGARPFVTKKEILNVIHELDFCVAAAIGVTPKDTIKTIDKKGFTDVPLNRDELIQIQTPQGFKTDVILSAHIQAEKEQREATDDCALLEYTGVPVKVLEGSYNNIKITTPEDIAIAKGILSADNR